MRRRSFLAAASTLLAIRPAGAQTVVALGPYRLVVPDSTDRNSLTMAVTWPGLDGAIGRSLPPRTVLTVAASGGGISVGEEVRNARLFEGGRPSPASRFGLHEIYTGRHRPQTVFLVDDWADPHLLLTYPREEQDPTRLWLLLHFDGDRVRISVRLYGALLHEWQAIRARIADLMAQLGRDFQRDYTRTHPT